MNDYALAAVKALGDGDGNGSFQAVLSTSALDRDGEVIETRAFDPLPESIPIYFEHDWMSGAAPVGRGVPYYAPDGTLMLDGTFASTNKAQEVRALVVEGMVDAMSVGFLNAKREVRSGVRTVTAGDVFEGSLTAIPINTGAKLLAAKAFAGSKAGARNSTADQTLIQTIHDNAAALGALCEPGNAIGKAVATVEHAADQSEDDATTDDEDVTTEDDDEAATADVTTLPTGAAEDAAATTADEAVVAAAEPAADEVEQALARIRLAVMQAIPA